MVKTERHKCVAAWHAILTSCRCIIASVDRDGNLDGAFWQEDKVVQTQRLSSRDYHDESLRIGRDRPAKFHAPVVGHKLFSNCFLTTVQSETKSSQRKELLVSG